MRCTEKDRLLTVYAKTQLYSFAVTNLHLMRRKASNDEYNDARELSEDACAQCNTARADLDRHQAQHGC
jgi:hypothetical protein